MRSPAQPGQARNRSQRPMTMTASGSAPHWLFALLLCFLCCCTVVLGQQFFVSTQSPLDATRGFSLCAITPTEPLSSDGSGFAESIIGSPRNCFDAQGTRQSHSISNAVYAAHRCVMNTTGFAFCSSSQNSVRTSPWPVNDMLMGDDLMVPTCALFANGTISCTNPNQLGPHFGWPAVPLTWGTFQGWQPTPLAFVNASAQPPVTVLQIARADVSAAVAYPGSACFLLSNSSIRCAATDPSVSALVTDAPQFDGRIPVHVCTGGANACVLYRDGSIYCWGAGGCPGGLCSPPDLVLFSSIACGTAFTCGIRGDGGVSCWGSPLMSSGLDPPAGIFSQIVISAGIPCALSAIDASIQCWGLIADEIFGNTLAVPTASVGALGWQCALRTKINPTLTPQVACWSETGTAIGSLRIPASMAHTPFRSIAVTSFYICVQFASDNSTWCDGDESSSEASFFLDMPTNLGSDLQAIGTIPGATNRMYAWLGDGRLVTWGESGGGTLLPPFVNNNTEYRFRSFSIQSQPDRISMVVAGVLLNGSAVYVSYPDDSKYCPDQLRPQDVLEIVSNNITRRPEGAPALAFTDLQVINTDAAACGDVCGALNSGQCVCWGTDFSAAARQLQSNRSVLLVPTDPAQGRCTKITIQDVLEDNSSFMLCMLFDSGSVDCLFLQNLDHTASPGDWSWNQAALPASNANITDIYADIDTLMYAKAHNDAIAVWAPGGVFPVGRIAALPTISLEVAPQHTFRYRAGPITACPPGTFSLGVGAISSVCSGQCAAGRYGGGNATNANCAGPCPRGFYCPSGTSTPLPCKAGTFGAREGGIDEGCSGSCLAGHYCPPGSVAPDAIACASGFASSQPSTPCAVCPLNTFSGLPPSAICTPCPPSSFAPSQGMQSCLQCPSVGIDCGLGFAAISVGYWARVGNVSDPDFVANLGPYACPPGYCDGSATSGQASNGVVLVTPCSVHRSLGPENPLCGRCDPGYWEWNSVCTDCPPINWPILFLLILFVFALVGGLHLLSQSTASSARLSVLVYFAQSSVLLLRARSSNEISRVFAWLHVFNLNWMSPTGGHCVGQLNAQQALVLEALLPLAALAPLVVFALVRYCRMQQRARSAAPFPVHEYIRTTIAILLISYQQLCISAITYLQCVDVGPYRVVFSRPSIDCRGDTWKALMPFAVLLLVLLTVVVPAALAWFLYQHRAEVRAEQSQHPQSAPSVASEKSHALSMLSADHETEAVAQVNPSRFSAVAAAAAAGPALSEDSMMDHLSVSSPFALSYSALYAAFRPGCYPWLVFLLLRRVALVATAVLLLSSPAYQSLVFSLLCLFVLAVHVLLQPYRLQFDNQLEGLALLALLMLAQVLASQSGPQDEEMPLGIQFLAGLLLMVPALTLVTVCAEHLWTRPKVRLLRSWIRRRLRLGRSSSPPIAQAAGNSSPLLPMSDSDAGYKAMGE